MGRPNFEKLEVDRLSEKLSDVIWHIVKAWDYFTKDPLGKQILRSADNIGANIAEGEGRLTISH
jgi:four helix bundle protein